MILVDSSAWIELLRDTGSRAHRTIARLVGEGATLATTEVVVGELLAGVRHEIDYRRLRRQLLSLEMLSLNGLRGFERAAEISRECRAKGISPSLTDCLVAAPALASGAPVLHADRHFEAIASITDLTTYPLD